MRLQILLCFTMLGLSGCSSLLYRPSIQQYFDPQANHLKTDEIWLPVQSGKIQVWYFHHKSASNKERPKALLLFFHGNGENLTSHYRTLTFLLDYGYDFAIFDYRGYRNSVFGSTSLESSTSPRSTVEDGIEFLQWGESYARQAHIPWVVFGQSLGGAVALRAVIEVKNQFRPNLVIVDSTFASYQEEGRDVLSGAIVTWPFQWVSYLLLSDKWAPEKRIAEISPTPLWVLHGNEDGIVSYDLGREIYHLAKKPKQFWHIEGGHHIDALWMHHGQFRRKLVLELDRMFAPKSHSIFSEYGWSPTRPNEIPIPDETYAYTLPFPVGMKYEVLQGFDGHFSHQGENRYSIDFTMLEGTPVSAIRDGEVIQVKIDSQKGGASSRFENDANFILIRHEDGTIAEYYHLKPGGSAVRMGQHVKAGDLIGYSGQTGFATEPHLHIAVYFIDSQGVKNTVPIVFDTDREPALRLEQGESYERGAPTSAFRHPPPNATKSATVS